MRYLSRNRRRLLSEPGEADPLAGLANLFDIGLVFIVGLLMTLFAVYRMQDLFDQRSEVTILKRGPQGELEIITKRGTRVKALRATRDRVEGRGERLGTAYRLEDGTVVYVPE